MDGIEGVFEALIYHLFKALQALFMPSHTFCTCIRSPDTVKSLALSLGIIVALKNTRCSGTGRGFTGFAHPEAYFANY